MASQSQMPNGSIFYFLTLYEYHFDFLIDLPVNGGFLHQFVDYSKCVVEGIHNCGNQYYKSSYGLES